MIDFDRAGHNGFRAGRRTNDDVGNVVERRGSVDSINAVRKFNDDGASGFLIRVFRPTLRDFERFGERRDRRFTRTVGGVVPVRRDANRPLRRGVQNT